MKNERMGNPCGRCEYLLTVKGMFFFWCPGPHEWASYCTDPDESIVRYERKLYERSQAYGRARDGVWDVIFYGRFFVNQDSSLGYSMALKEAVRRGFVGKDRMDEILGVKP